MTETRFPEARAPRGMVATPHLLATQSGVAALRAGGNALDAAIAAAATIAVVYPHMNGLGGDNVWLILDARSQNLRALCGVGRAARAATIDWYGARGLTQAPPAHGSELQSHLNPVCRLLLEKKHNPPPPTTDTVPPPVPPPPRGPGQRRAAI